MPRDIALLGMMGVGKSTVAEHLAGLMRREVVATDALVEERAGKPIAEIFADDGEEQFRGIEREVVASLADAPEPHRRVIDLGGGVVLDPDNVSSLERHATLVMLTAPLPTLVSRLADASDKRPLLAGSQDLAETLRELIEEREPRYVTAAEHIEEADRPVPVVSLEILRWAAHQDGVLTTEEQRREEQR